MRKLLVTFSCILALGGCKQAADTHKEPEKKPKKTSNDSGVLPSTARKPQPVPKANPQPQVKVPAPQKATVAQMKTHMGILKALVKKGAAEAENPWAMAHGLIAFGPKMKASDGRLAIDAMISDHAELKVVGGKKVHRFAAKTKGGLPLEPHRDMLVKTLVDIGVPLKRKFKLKDGSKVSLKRLVEDAIWAYQDPVTHKDWHNQAWSLGLFLASQSSLAQLKTQSGSKPLQLMALKSFLHLEEEQAFLLPLMAQNAPEKVQKRKQGIYGHSCGGLHFVQAALRGSKLQSEDSMKLRVAKQLDLVLFRWRAERALYRRMMQQQPKYASLLLIQELKFYGHVLETFGLAAEWGLVDTSDEKLKATLSEVAFDLIRTINQLQPVYAAQGELRKVRPQSYYDLIGDGCHAVRGLRSVLVAFFAKQ